MFVTTGFLTSDVAKRDTSLGAYLRETFPDLKPLQIEYKTYAGPLLVEGMRETAGTIGTALDLIVQMIVNPFRTPPVARYLFPFNDAYRAVVDELASIVGVSEDPEAEARAVYAMADCVGAFRAGMGFEVERRLRTGQFRVDIVMEDASRRSVTELIALREIIQERLIPTLAMPYWPAPTFDLSTPGPEHRIAAEADLISAGHLIDIKATFGERDATGKRYDVLKPEHLYQILGYALLDHSNRYGIEQIGIFSARYGYFAEWPLAEAMLETRGGRRLGLKAARQQVWDLMHEKREQLQR